MKKRISVTLDERTAKLLEQTTEKGKVSEFVNEAILQKVYEQNLKKLDDKLDVFERVEKLQKKLKHKSTPESILKNIERGRL